jgi:23S rRNA (guanosine2251-2'-O)-methyltransferase
MRKPGTKKGAVVGSGGQKPKGLRGRGATHGPVTPASARKATTRARIPRVAGYLAGQARNYTAGRPSCIQWEHR